MEQFHALEKYYKDEYNIIIDTSCKDISRCMLLSFDENLYCNPFSEVYPELYLPEIIKQSEKKLDKAQYYINIETSDLGELIENITKKVEENSIDLTSNYV